MWVNDIQKKDFVKLISENSNQHFMTVTCGLIRKKALDKKIINCKKHVLV